MLKPNLTNEKDATVKCCRICLQSDAQDENNMLISPCKCSGSSKYVHKNCLEEWIGTKALKSKKDQSE